MLSYASYALDNWRRLDPASPIELGNIALLQNFLGGLDEEWFVLVHVDIEAKAGKALAGSTIRNSGTPSATASACWLVSGRLIWTTPIATSTSSISGAPAIRPAWGRAGRRS